MTAKPKIVVQSIWDVTVVDFQEPRLLDPEQLQVIGQELYRLVDQMDRKKLILDFTKVQFLASAALGTLLELHKKSKAIKGSVVICGLRSDLKRVFEIMRLTKLFKFCANEDEALAAFGYTAAH